MCVSIKVELGARAESEPDFVFLCRSGAGVTIKKNLEAALEPESYFKVVF